MNNAERHKELTREIRQLTKQLRGYINEGYRVDFPMIEERDTGIYCQIGMFKEKAKSKET